MVGVVEKLQKVGLTEYEAKAYVGLLSDHLSTATKLSEVWASADKDLLGFGVAGTEANTGSISFSTLIFNITWLGDEIFDVSTMEYSKCVKCLRQTFDGAWRYSQKW